MTDKNPIKSSERAPSRRIATSDRRTAVFLLLIGAFCAGMGQTIVFSILPPLAREIGLSEQKVGFIFMISAVCWVTLGPQWGRHSDSFGRKPFILLGLAGFAASMILFGASIRLGLAGVLSGLPLYVIMVMTRSLYGILGSAGPPAAQAYIADRSPAIERTAGISSFSAAFGFGAMLGPGFGAIAALIGPVTPFFAIAVFSMAMLAAVYIFLPERSPPIARDPSHRIRVTDKRLRPFLIFGLGFGVANAVPIQTIGFFFLDRLNVSTTAAPQIVGVALMGAAMASLFAQLIIVQRLRVAPRWLLRIAPLLICAGHFLIWASHDIAPVAIGMLLSGFGAGLAVPAFNAAASLAVNADEQGAAIGLSNAAGASGFIIAPLIAFTLYDISPQTPFLFTMTLAACLWVFALSNRSVRRVGQVCE